MQNSETTDFILGVRLSCSDTSYENINTVLFATTNRAMYEASTQMPDSLLIQLFTIHKEQNVFLCFTSDWGSQIILISHLFLKYTLYKQM